MAIYIGGERREVNLSDVEPVASFVQKIGRRIDHNTFAVDLFSAGHMIDNRVVVDKTQLDIFAAQLAALKGERPELTWLHDLFIEAFPGADAGTFTESR